MGDDENACVRNIVKEIMRECNSKKIKVNKNFVVFLTKLLLMDPTWGIGDDFFNQRYNVQVFVKYVIEELLSKQDEVRIITLKIQFYFSCNLEHMDYAIELNRKALQNKLASLKEAILKKNKVDTKEEVDLWLKKFVYYITLITGLGNPSKSKVYEEVLLALKSVFHDDEINEFISLPKQEKIMQLQQLTKVVAGIRLFNKDCGKGGEGIMNLPELLNAAIGVIKQGTEQYLLAIMEKVNALTTVVDKCYVMRQSYKGYQMNIEFPVEAIKLNVELEVIKDLLVFFRQYELIIRWILEELERNYEKSELIFTNMEKLLKTIHDTVYMKIAISVTTIFPLFEELWMIWEQFQNQALMLSRLSVIMSNLQTYAKQTRYNSSAIDTIIGESPSMTDAERLAQTAHVTLSSYLPEIRVIRSDTVKNIDNIDLEYLGFCCWNLVETDGALIPGNPSMGIVEYKGKNYVFSNEEAFREFTKKPQTYVNDVLALARRKPQFINFFKLKEELESVYKIAKLVHSTMGIRLCEDKYVQTVTNIEESHIDRHYQWNIWDLRKEAVFKASISSTATRSTQTKTTSKNAIKCQTYSTKKVEIQTGTDNHTSVPKPSTFIYGLRGRKDDQQFKIDLTRPVEEQ